MKMESLLGRAIESSGSVIIITDVKGDILYVNPRFTEVTGYTKEEALGRNPRLLNSKIHEAELFKNLWDSVLAGESWVGEIKNRKKDGSLYWAHLNVTPVKGPDGEIENLIAIQEDISEIKQLVEQLRATQIQMIQQEKLAGIGHLAAGVAHEVNNPLGYITSNVETLKKYNEVITKELIKHQNFVNLHKEQLVEMGSPWENSGVDSEKRTSRLNYIISETPVLINDIEGGLKRISDIVHSLRNFSKTNREEETMEYDLNEGLQDTINIARSEFKHVATVELQLGNIPLIPGNGGQLNQTWLNFIINASQALKEIYQEVEGIIKVSTYLEEEFIVCEFEDNGPGVPDENKKLIFNPFFTTKPVGMGSGLGLGIAHDIIVNKHGGMVTVEDSALGGALFRVKLPVKKLRTNQDRE